MPGPVAEVRKLLIRGLLTVLPLLITLWLLSILFQIVNSRVTPIVSAILRMGGVEDPSQGLWAWVGPLLGLVVVVGLLLVFGLLATNFLGKRFLAGFERLLSRIPLVRSIHGSAKQLLEALTVGKKGGFREVVALEFPRRGVWMLGFVSSEMPASALGIGQVGSVANVFVPTTPNPTSGFLVVLPEAELRRLPISVEEGIKMVVSGGLVLPHSMVPPAPGATGGAAA